MIQFTEKQIDMLYQMSDIHYKWFIKYNPDNDIKYEDVLKINHQKMMDIAESCFDHSEEMLDIIFESVIRDYEEMLRDLE